MKKLTYFLIILSIIVPILKITYSEDLYKLAFQSGDDFKLFYYVKDENIYFKMVGKTKGYVAIGFKPTSKMKDADIIIGYVLNNGVNVFDLYSTGEFGPHPEDVILGGKHNIFSVLGEEKGEYTIIEFARALDTKDKYDALLTLDEDIKIIWAISGKDDINAKHTKRGSGVIKLSKLDAITEPSPKVKTVLKLKIGDTKMYINDSPKFIDVAPIIIEGRTLLPIRWIAEPLGAEVLWDGNEKRVTVILGQTIIELWIGNKIAKVNGKDSQIDPNNPNVTPIILNGRTMLPVRFVAENLGCSVEWDSKTKTITITYPK